jgi:4-amino-4-deoxy-L-arabinose transferase-like glycosyltransferase
VHIRPLTAIVLVGLTIRALWTFWAAPIPPFFSDSEYYDAVARSLVRGDGYSVVLTHEGFFPGGDATAFFPPGYSFLIAASYFVFDESIEVARLLNVVLGTLTIPLVYLIGRRLFGEMAGLIGAGLAAVMPSLVLWTPVLLSETAFTFVFAVAIAAFVYARREDGALPARSAAIAGVIMGLALLVRGQALVLLPAAVLWWRFAGADTGTALRAGGIALAAAALVLLPWSVRNTLVFDSPVLLSTNLGYNLRVGHAPYSTGRFVDPEDLLLSARDYQHLELLQHQTGFRRAVDYAAGNPVREMELSIAKVRYMWSPDSDVLLWVESFGATPLPDGWQSPLRWLVVLSHWAVIGLATASLLAWRSQAQGVVFVVLLALAWTGIHVIFFGEPRFRLPLLPALLPAAALGVVLVGALMARAGRRIGVRGLSEETMSTS